MRRLGPVLVGTLAIAAVSTLGDFVWATWIPRHRAIYGLTHGTLLFLAVGAFLGALTGRVPAGVAAGAAIGFLAAGSFYVLAPLAGYWVMLVSWCAVWIALAFTYARLGRSDAAPRAIILRALAAAVAAPLAFYLVRGIWMPFDPEGWDFAWHFAAWAFVYFAGFSTLLLSSSSPAR